METFAFHLQALMNTIHPYRNSITGLALTASGYSSAISSMSGGCSSIAIRPSQTAIPKNGTTRHLPISIALQHIHHTTTIPSYISSLPYRWPYYHFLLGIHVQLTPIHCDGKTVLVISMGHWRCTNYEYSYSSRWQILIEPEKTCRTWWTTVDLTIEYRNPTTTQTCLHCPQDDQTHSTNAHVKYIPTVTWQCHRLHQQFHPCSY